MLDGAMRWLVAARNADGGWGGHRGVASSIEETALAVCALADFAAATGKLDTVQESVADGCQWLSASTDGARRFVPAPIGLYFARLW